MFGRSLAFRMVTSLIVFALAIFLLLVIVSELSFLSGVQILAISLGLFLFGFLIKYFWDVVWPLKKIIRQMEALTVGKPFKKIYTTRKDEIGVIANFFNQVTEGLDVVSEDIVENERMLDELTIASQLQQEILPEQSVNVPGLQIVAKTRPATEVGGDSFDFFTINDKTYIYIGDVTGHGVGAGLIMSMVNAFVKVFADTFDNAREIIIHVNKYIKRRIRKAMFMTMVMLSWDHKSQKMTFVGAGHEHILVYRGASGVCEAILSGGIALGMVPDNSQQAVESEIKLEDGDFVVLFSDGITEARNKAGEQFGLENLKRSLIEYAPQYSAEGVNYHIAKDVSEFMKGTEQRDDMTLIVLKHDLKIKGGEKLESGSTAW